MRRIGAEIEDRRTAIEDAIETATPLPDKGDVMAVSYDGVMAPMRETNAVAWREAGVASVSIYGPGDAGPEKLDTRHLARMPESGMVTLLQQIADQVARAKKGRVFREFAIICDGKNTFWKAAMTQPVLHDAVWILDFYHASENLTKAAKAIFGDDDESNRCHRMRYAEFIARGLPIGSGPVESAAKNRNIVLARLKRSGVRWSRDGGQHVHDLRVYLKSGRWEPMWYTMVTAA